LKLYRVLRKTSRTQPPQVVFYDPGVGTLARPDPWTKLKQDTITVLGLATGYGLDDNVLAAYRFLISNYEDGDAIYLFGFSRGAYAVRMLAGLIHKVGLPAPQQQNLAGAALTAYKQSVEHETVARATPDSSDEEEDQAPGPRSQDDRAAQFARIVSVKWPTIAFLGVWDTVATVIVPRPDRFYTFSLQELPHTRHNPSVRVFRQAIALDERRRMFRLHPWAVAQIFMHNLFSKTNNSEPQDAQQVWFAGSCRYRRRLSGVGKRSFQVPTVVDDRRGGGPWPRHQSTSGQSVGLGRPAAWKSLHLCRARFLVRASSIDDVSLARFRIFAEM
jgi:uncharacterized protein (DUF2235 family)